LHEGHLAAVLETVRRRGARVAQILLTHGHADHAESAARFAELAGAPVRALDPAHRLGSEGLADGEVLAVGGLELRVIGTPGHSGDSLSFLLPADRAMLTGDTVLGRGTTLVSHPDGTLADYLDSLNLLRESAARHEFDTVLPGHGPVLSDALGVLDFYLAHRKERLAQVEAAVAAGDASAAEVVRRVYADVDPAVWPAAELSVRAQLHYLDPVRFD
jgi:glyoxylase-like metal-dependent hydrolase (beta-lactamase superfamily II)